ncbi:protein TolR [Dongia sedimenti]|uniref:Protein TolR n=1 Tax=Dongia sedimenti TaxID=3064282 RepID=A0ABU0YFK4_9PROT|nr:protein TolR [Rhodospirillaceae bacterium R-7]
MAVKLGHHGRARGYGARRKAQPMSEINVTPMVDVMLVLLVIFMVTAPLLTVGVPVQLPKTKAAAMTNPDEPIVVSVEKDGGVFLQETRIELDQLGPRLAAITANKPDTTIYVRADQDTNYGTFAQVLAELQASGFSKVGLVTDSKTPGDTSPSKPSGGDSKDKSKPTK